MLGAERCGEAGTRRRCSRGGWWRLPSSSGPPPGRARQLPAGGVEHTDHCGAARQGCRRPALPAVVRHAELRAAGRGRSRGEAAAGRAQRAAGPGRCPQAGCRRRSRWHHGRCWSRRRRDVESDEIDEAPGLAGAADGVGKAASLRPSPCSPRPRRGRARRRRARPAASGRWPCRASLRRRSRGSRSPQVRCPWLFAQLRPPSVEVAMAGDDGVGIEARRRPPRRAASIRSSTSLRLAPRKRRGLADAGADARSAERRWLPTSELLDELQAQRRAPRAPVRGARARLAGEMPSEHLWMLRPRSAEIGTTAGRLPSDPWDGSTWCWR